MIQYMDQIRKILETPVPVSLATCGDGGAHLVGVWNDDVLITGDDSLLIPVMGMRDTEANIINGSDVALLVASREVDNRDGAGQGFRITGSGEFHLSGEKFEFIKSKFDWARAALEVSITKVERLI